MNSSGRVAAVAARSGSRNPGPLSSPAAGDLRLGWGDGAVWPGLVASGFLAPPGRGLTTDGSPVSWVPRSPAPPSKRPCTAILPEYWTQPNARCEALALTGDAGAPYRFQSWNSMRNRPAQRRQVDQLLTRRGKRVATIDERHPRWPPRPEHVFVDIASLDDRAPRAGWETGSTAVSADRAIAWCCVARRRSGKVDYVSITGTAVGEIARAGAGLSRTRTPPAARSCAAALLHAHDEADAGNFLVRELHPAALKPCRGSA